MESGVSKRNLSVSIRHWMLQLISYCRNNLRAIAMTVALLAIISELGGIWHEIHEMRNEQVKNAKYALPKERRDALHETVFSKKLESTSFVNGEVEVDGDVQLSQPVEVEIDQ